jgi:hypothetical protein
MELTQVKKHHLFLFSNSGIEQAFVPDEGMTQRVLIFGLYGLGLEASLSKG